jgi:hypothetical protein
MEITVKIPDELAAEARERGVPLETYVEELLTKQMAAHRRGAIQQRTAAEIRAWLDSLAQFSDKIPPLPKSISREWLYQDHD